MPDPISSVPSQPGIPRPGTAPLPPAAAASAPPAAPTPPVVKSPTDRLTGHAPAAAGAADAMLDAAAPASTSQIAALRGGRPVNPGARLEDPNLASSPAVADVLLLRRTYHTAKKAADAAKAELARILVDQGPALTDAQKDTLIGKFKDDHPEIAAADEAAKKLATSFSTNHDALLAAIAQDPNGLRAQELLETCKDLIDTGSRKEMLAFVAQVLDVPGLPDNVANHFLDDVVEPALAANLNEAIAAHDGDVTAALQSVQADFSTTFVAPAGALAKRAGQKAKLDKMLRSLDAMSDLFKTTTGPDARLAGFNSLVKKWKGAGPLGKALTVVGLAMLPSKLGDAIKSDKWQAIVKEVAGGTKDTAEFVMSATRLAEVLSKNPKTAGILAARLLPAVSAVASAAGSLDKASKGYVLGAIGDGLVSGGAAIAMFCPVLGGLVVGVGVVAGVISEVAVGHAEELKRRDDVEQRLLAIGVDPAVAKAMAHTSAARLALLAKTTGLHTPEELQRLVACGLADSLLDVDNAGTTGALDRLRTLDRSVDGAGLVAGLEQRFPDPAARRDALTRALSRLDGLLTEYGVRRNLEPDLTLADHLQQRVRGMTPPEAGMAMAELAKALR